MSVDAHVARLAAALAQLCIDYAMGLVFATGLGITAALGVAYVFAWRRMRRPQLVAIPIELAFGLVHPIFYLVAIEPLIAHPAQVRVILRVLGWVALAAFWCLRFGGGRRLGARRDAVSVRVAQACVGLIVVFFALDSWLALEWLALKAFAVGLDPSSSVGQITLRTAVSLAFFVAVTSGLLALYIVPVIIGRRYARPLAREIFTEPKQLSRPLLAILALTLGLGLVVGFWRPSACTTHALVEKHRGDILAAARAQSVDPRTLAAIIDVTHRRHISIFRDDLERLAVAIWLTDPKSDFHLFTSFNISIGLAQIKPVTVLTAMAMLAKPPSSSSCWYYKEYREVPHDLPVFSVSEVESLNNPFATCPGKADVVDALQDDPRNILTEALLLRVIAAQWQTTFDISQRPDILATLYQIGFEKSHPHAAPVANDFGKEVQAVHDSEWMQKLFER